MKSPEVPEPAAIPAPSPTPADLLERKAAAQQKYATDMVEMAYREERHMFRKVCHRLIAGLVAAGILVLGMWLGPVREELIPIRWLVPVLQWLNFVLLVVIGFVAVFSPVAFTLALVSWVLAMKERRRVVASAWHLDARYAAGLAKPDPR